MISPAGGSYTTAQTVTITDATSGATIYYTTDGSTPTTSSTVYSGAITVSQTETVNAIAAASGITNSAMATATYTLPAGGATTIDFSQGFAASAGLMAFNGSTDLDDSRLQLTNGGEGEAGSAWYYQPVNIQTFTTNFTFQLSNPAADGITFAIQNAGISALGGNGGYLGYGGIPTSVAIKFDLYSNAGEDPDSTGLYINGAVPETPAIDLSSTGIDLHSGDSMIVQLNYNGTTLSMTITDTVTAATWSTSWTVNIPSIVGGNTAYVGFTGGTGGLTSSQKILTWTYSNPTGQTQTAATPTFSPVAGTYSAAQTVTISDATAGATIYYTTNGTTPTTSSTLYARRSRSAATETLEAIAVASGYTNSTAGTAAYTITPTAATPTFSPAAGTYSTAQTVTISDATAGAAIYYTTNGTTPTTSSTKYLRPITVTATETLEAIAVASGYTNSAAGTAAYTITPTAATPTFSPAAGTYATAQTVTITDATAGAAIYYTTNGTTPTTSSTKYTAAITVSATETLKAIAVASGYANSAAGTAAYTISTVAATPVSSPSSATLYRLQLVTLTDATRRGQYLLHHECAPPRRRPQTLYTGCRSPLLPGTRKCRAIAWLPAIRTRKCGEPITTVDRRSRRP